ncbi:polypeptide N-acetylgalactosaminyltransferase 5-like [Ornithodoros turicata]|uniref:polypeptide N-acetylgalactosaminyltransferase 5-like n=1 Tax=Ornithodoros turicata TaxID=34597 RepID=UPI003138FA72
MFCRLFCFCHLWSVSTISRKRDTLAMKHRHVATLSLSLAILWTVAVLFLYGDQQESVRGIIDIKRQERSSQSTRIINTFSSLDQSFGSPKSAKVEARLSGISLEFQENVKPRNTQILLVGVNRNLSFADLPAKVRKAERHTIVSDTAVKEGWKLHAFNQIISDQISPIRSLPDARHPACQDLNYQKKLPDTSVVICFRNEAWSTLLRTVHSVINRSPRELLREVILVDDFSDMNHLGKELDSYVAHLPKVRLLRLKKREGLARARMAGTAVSTGAVITFLDSHCECTNGWLEPLLDRVSRDPTTVVCPVIDVINDNTFAYNAGHYGSVQVGGFDWSLNFRWNVVPEREVRRRQFSWEPLRSPTMAGGLFAIDKAFFKKLGMYDEGFEIWGGENLELSFKIWMCGGTLEIVPCSHVGHVFRARNPNVGTLDFSRVSRNSMRVAEVWLDDYAKYYYERTRSLSRDIGDVEPQKALRRKLRCRSFRWYLDTVYPELFVPDKAVASGEIQTQMKRRRLCADQPAERLRAPILLYGCHGLGGNQNWYLTLAGEIRRDESCFDYDSTSEDVMLYKCHGKLGNQQWVYNHDSGTIYHVISKKCLGTYPDGKKLRMVLCNETRRRRWQFQHYKKP